MKEKDSIVSLISYSKINNPTCLRIKQENIYYYNEYSKDEHNNSNNLSNNNNLTLQINNKRDKDSSYYFIGNISYLPCSFSDDSAIKIEDNKIIHNGKDGWETCLIGETMSEGRYKIEIGKKNCKCSFGIIDDSFTHIKSGMSISEMNAGIEMRFDCSDKFISFPLSNSSLNDLSEEFYDSKFRPREREDNHPLYIYNRSNKKVGSGTYKKNSPVSIEIDLRSSDPYKRYAYFYDGIYEADVYFCGLPPTVRFAVYFLINNNNSYIIFIIYYCCYVCLICFLIFLCYYYLYVYIIIIIR